MISSSANELFHGILPTSYHDNEDGYKHKISLQWRTSKLVGWQIDRRNPILGNCDDKDLSPTVYNTAYPIVLNHHMFQSDEYFEHYYIQDALGLHPSFKLGTRKFDTVEDAKSYVLTLFQRKYPNVSVQWENYPEEFEGPDGQNDIENYIHTEDEYNARFGDKIYEEHQRCYPFIGKNKK